MAKVGAIVWAFSAMVCWAVTNFLLSVVAKETSSPADANLSGTCVLWVAAGMCFLPLLIFQMATTGVLKGINGLRNAANAYIAGLASSSGMLVLALALASDPNSAGPITAVLPLNGLLVCFLAWIILGEKLTRSQLMGVGIAVIGPVLMAVADRSNNALRGVAYGGAAAVLLGASNFLRKFVLTRGVKNAMDVQLLVWLAVGSCGAISILAMYACGRGLKGLDSLRLLIIASAAGLIWALGSLCFQFSLQGLAGPATAIANTNGAGVLLLQIVLYHPQIPVLKLIGMGLAMFGATIITLSPKPKHQHELQHQGETSTGAALVAESQA